MFIFPENEEKILKFWKKNKIFEKSLKNREDARRFVFYEGPPFANARPGIHHILARSFKDLFARYKTMKGYYVARKAGWDTHGLPVEMEVEKKFGISSKREIEKIGIEKFIKAAEENIFTYKTQWEEMTERMGYWLDLKNAYITCKNEYIESVWWVLKQIWDKGLIYQDYKVLPYCPRCGTSLSDHEVALGYKEARDPSVYVKFSLPRRQAGILNSQFSNTYFLVWTTTPWTLPANVALAVNPDFEYVQIRIKDDYLILAKKRLSVIKEDYEIIGQFKGKDLVGLEYQPLYKFYQVDKKAKVVEGDFVSLEEGTGIVHIAPAFGAEDLQLAKKWNLPIILSVDEEGKFKTEVKPWAGKPVKKADPEIIEDLEKQKLVYKKETILHSYPFCWRCETPLLYLAKTSWYIKTTAVARKMLDNNEKINWVPSYIKQGRFGNWLKENVDWVISRERYWGTPIPIWRCQNCNHKIIIGSLEELQKLSIKPLDIQKLDLHRPYIDEITLKCEKCGSEMRRIPEVLDVWFDSGSMPYAQWHYPFENKEKFKQSFPADFIAEGIDQTRGWFYTLLAISTLLDFGEPYKNVISLGLVLDEKGQKMSKSKGNIVIPQEMMDKYGADSVRLYFYLSPLGETVRFSEKDLAEVFRKFIITLHNSFTFYKTYLPMKFKPDADFISKNIVDIWIISKLNQTQKEITRHLDKYEITRATRLLYSFVLDDLSNWYIRRSRKRLTPEFFQTLHRILFDIVRISAPFVPFISEEIYQELQSEEVKKLESVHLEDWPEADKNLINEDLNNKMDLVRRVAELGLAIRAENKIKVRQPLAEMRIEDRGWKLEESLLNLIEDELNVKEVPPSLKLRRARKKLGRNWVVKEENGLKIALNTKITPQLKQEGIVREVVRHIQEIRKRAGFKAADSVSIFWHTNGKELLGIMQKYSKEIAKETRSKLKRETKVIEMGEEVVIDGEKLKIRAEAP